MRYKLDWIPEVIDERSWRVKVLGGWIVGFIVTGSKGNPSITSQFIPDRNHQWIILKPETVNTIAEE